jgi:hypothetical protein
MGHGDHQELARLVGESLVAFLVGILQDEGLDLGVFLDHLFDQGDFRKIWMAVVSDHKGFSWQDILMKRMMSVPPKQIPTQRPQPTQLGRPWLFTS